MENGAASAPERLQSVEIALTRGGTRRFFYRESSRTDLSVINQIFQAQHYNFSGLPLSPSLKKYANEASRNGESLLVVDAGANIGASALYFTQLDPRIHVCAVEPDPGNFMVLRENAMGLPITPVEAAVASKDGKLWLSDPGIGEWGFRAGSTAGNIQVASISIDNILRRFPAAVPLICKIDIEGGEADLFSANDAWVDRFPLIVIELHDWLLPGTGSSQNFLRAIARRNFDVVFRGENLFCFNNDLLSK